MKTLNALAFMLAYPEENAPRVLPECLHILETEDWVPKTDLSNLKAFVSAVEGRDLLDWQEEYVALFDRTPSLSLHLFEHIHGDSRERGQALVDLLSLYREAGLEPETGETPDYLPMFLEYLSTLEGQKAQENLGSVVDITAALAERHKLRETPYAAIFSALVSLAASRPNPKAVHAALEKATGAAYGFQQIDKEWEEQFAFANNMDAAGTENGCPKTSEMIARMYETVPGKEG